MSTELSPRAARLHGSPTTALFARVAELRRQGRDIISFSVGEPDFDTPENIKAAAKRAIDAGETKYTVGAGVLPLREAITRKLREDNGLVYAPDELALASGAKQAIQSAVMAVAGPGDEVILPIPCWVSYAEIVRLAGAEPVLVPTRAEDYALDLAAIEAAVTPRTKLLILCSPNNPTGAVYGEESLRALAELAREHDFFLLADEIYEKLIYGGARHFSVASASEDARQRTITVNGFSKAYAMTGWRLGYAAARRDVIDAVLKLQSQVTSCACSISQQAAIEALNGPQDELRAMVAEFARRKDYTLSRLRAIPDIVCPDGWGAFYLFPDVRAYLGRSGVETSAALCEYLLDEALVGAVPGEAFGLAGRIRISYSNSMENLREGMDRIGRALAKL